MATYRTRQAEVEAVQWVPGVEHPAIKRNPRNNPMTSGACYVQNVRLREGDWVVCVSPDVPPVVMSWEIFRLLFEPFDGEVVVQ